MDKAPLPPAAVEAHRGASATHPENTLAAFRAAADAGAVAIECDLSLLADGGLCVFHDAGLGRTAHGDAAIASLTAADLEGIDAGSWKDARFAGERIPLFTDALAFQRERRIRFNWEIKPHGLKDAPAAMIASMRRAMTDEANIALSMLSSFDRAVLAEARAAFPELPRGLLAAALPDDWREAVAEYDCAAVHLDKTHLAESHIRAVKEAGLQLRVFTVNDRDTAAQLIDLGVDAVITDRVEEFLSTKKRAR